ncbi:MAG: hypothetical protein ACYCYK_12220 [Candidatus Dormibacteria bacterium]
MNRQEHTAPSRRLVPAAALALVTAAAVVLPLLAGPVPAQPNGFGLFPSTVQLMQRSGVLLSQPYGRPTVPSARAVALARRQGRQDHVQRVFLALATSTGGGPLGDQPRLCWVVLLRANPNALGNLPAPGHIQLYMVLVDAQTGRFVEGVIAFAGQPQTGVGSE